MNVGPWGVHAHRIARDGDAFTVDGKPLITYHFSSLDPTPGGQDASSPYAIHAHRDAPALAALYAAYRAALAPEPHP